MILKRTYNLLLVEIKVVFVYKKVIDLLKILFTKMRKLLDKPSSIFWRKKRSTFDWILEDGIQKISKLLANYNL